MHLVPDTLACMAPCKGVLEEIKTNYINQKTCDDLKFPDKTFFNCYFRERRISAPPFANPKPMDAFLTQNATDIVVLTCYLQKHYYYSMNSVDGSKKVLYNDCVSLGKN